jgi:hypothetical protein
MEGVYIVRRTSNNEHKKLNNQPFYGPLVFLS